MNHFRLLCTVLIVAISSAVALGQDENKANTEGAPQTEARTNADETFELNISERRITRQDYEASTSVEAGEESARGLNLRVGVGIGAAEINVLLRNVRGRVRFRASLGPVLKLINSRRTNSNPSP